MGKQAFGGDKKLPMRTFLARCERRFIDANMQRFPKWIEGYHLTLMTILWSIGLIAFGWLARGNRHWLWLSSLMLFLQWFTDCFDGALGRSRPYRNPNMVHHPQHRCNLLRHHLDRKTAALDFSPCRCVSLYGCFQNSEVHLENRHAG